LLVFLFGSAAAVVHQEWRLPPHGAAQIGFLGLGVLAFRVSAGAAWWADSRNSPVWIQVVLGLSSTACLVYGVNVGLGWRRFGAERNPATFPRHEQCLAAGVVFGFVLVLAALAVRVGPRMLNRAVSGSDANAASMKTHDLAVYDVRPDPADPKNQFEPYFIALCSCGWVGDGKDTGDEALADARTHKLDVDSVIRVPGQP